MTIDYLIVNFGGPRSLEEVEPFLISLLTDRDVMRTNLPVWLQKQLFTRIAKKRALKVQNEYSAMGGSSPIFSDTEYVAQTLSHSIKRPVYTFHRYLPSTHEAALALIQHSEAEEIRVFPMFPQFTYATTGSIARFFDTYLKRNTVNRLKWVKSYPDHSQFVQLIIKSITQALIENKWKEEETLLLFSAHGVPLSFIEEGDLYLYECTHSFNAVMKSFPKGLGRLSFQSQFGRAKWIGPSTKEVCETILSWNQGRKRVLVIPISFTSDHLETLFEIEQQYLPLLRERGVEAYRLSAFNRTPEWIEAIASILATSSLVSNDMLIRR